MGVVEEGVGRHCRQIQSLEESAKMPGLSTEKPTGTGDSAARHEDFNLFTSRRMQDRLELYERSGRADTRFKSRHLARPITLRSPLVLRSRPHRSFLLVLATAVALLAASCTSGPKLYPVKGQVFHDNKPAEGATVVFHLKDGPANAPQPYGTVGADGSFTLNTHPHGEGAPAGEYVVLITWYPPNARELDDAKNKLPEQYGTPSSPLKATVKDGPTELEPFRIPK